MDFKLSHNIYKIVSTYFILPICFLLFSTCVFPQNFNDVDSAELNGDVIEYSTDSNAIIASGNVEIVYNNTKLYCDKVEFFRETKIAHAEGHVRLVTDDGEISGSRMTYNFDTKSGDFKGAKIVTDPYFGSGERVTKVSDNELVMENAFMTTCDHDKPHYKITSKKINVYTGDKLVAHNINLRLGKVPLLYLPRFSHSLIDSKPRLLLTPGYDSDWGAFLLTKWRYYLNENIKGTVHLDYRERLDLASGVDVEYKTPNTGDGIVRLYYTNERRFTTGGLFQEPESPAVERERFKAEWRHKWQINDTTDAIAQYYKISDSTFLKDFFERENDEDGNPDTFFLLTKALPQGTFSFRTDARVNRFEDKVERLPELRFDYNTQEIAETGFFLKNTSMYSNLTSKTASPSEVRQNTMRVDNDSELSYPMKVGIVEFRPFVGGRNTYYSKTKDAEKYNSVRGIFKTGASLSTKFYRIFDVNTSAFGSEINRLRHVITPSVLYEFNSEPTLAASQLDTFDGVDSLDNIHSINFSLENKFQTKRDGKSVDLMRGVIGTDFRLKEHPTGGGFDAISADFDIHPTDYFSLFFDAEYDTRRDHLDTFNFDLYLDGSEKWTFGVGKRFDREVDDQITTEFRYKINPIWAFRVFERFDIDSGNLKEQEYTLTRDLHAWEMDFNINDTLNDGTEFVLIFRLKAFPDIGFDFGKTYNRQRSGSE